MKKKEYLYNIPPYKAGKKVSGAIKLASNENPMGPSPLALEAIHQQLHNMNIYPDGSADALKSELSKQHNIEKNRIIIGNGSDEILCFLGLAFISPGDNAITSENTFSQYRFAVETNGGKMKTAPLREGAFNLKAIRNLVDSQTKVIFLCNPNNPTGKAFGENRLRTFLESLPSDILVVIDEAYWEYANKEDLPDSLEIINEYSNVLVTRTFSKIYGLAGLRVGYAFGDTHLIDYIDRVRGPFNTGILSQTGALAALSDHDFYDKSIKINEAGKRQLYEAFDEKGLFYYPTQTNFICVKMPFDADIAYKKILDGGVTIRSLTSFGMPQFIRVTVGTEEQNIVFLKALDKALS